MNWLELHKTTPVVDLHSHSMLKAEIFNRNLSNRNGKRLAKWFKESFWPFSVRATFPKVDEGGVDVLLSTAYVLEQGWIDDISIIDRLLWFTPSVRKKIVDPTYFDATKNMLDGMETQVDNYNNTLPDGNRKMAVASCPADITASIENGDISIVHSIEGAHSLQGTESGKTGLDNIMSHPEDIETEVLNNLEYFYNRGVAYLGLAHFYPNLCANPVFPYPEYGAKHMDWRKALGQWDETKGLTPLGLKVADRMLDLGMLIDIGHCTIKARKQLYDLVDAKGKSQCLLASHMGCFEINRLSYNLQDWELKWLADHGCAVGIIFMNYWLAPTDTGLGLKYIEQTLNHIINICGEDTAAIGTDFDGFTDPPDEIVDMSELPRITSYLKGVGYSDEIVKKFLGENALRVLINGWKKEQE
jgi:membrane dipeptidase